MFIGTADVRPQRLAVRGAAGSDLRRLPLLVQAVVGRVSCPCRLHRRSRKEDDAERRTHSLRRMPDGTEVTVTGL